MSADKRTDTAVSSSNASLQSVGTTAAPINAGDPEFVEHHHRVILMGALIFLIGYFSSAVFALMH